MTKDPSEKDFANHDFYHEPLDDWPLFYGTETFPRFSQYLEELKKRKKKKLLQFLSYLSMVASYRIWL